MGFFDYFPYTNFHELNLNWLLHVVKDLQVSYLEQSKTLEQIQEEIKNLNVPEIVKEQINDMIQSGELTDLFTPTWKDLYVKNKKFWLGDLYIISETAVNTLPTVGGKFAHYNNILYEWDNQLLQLKNTLSNIPANSSASIFIILLETKTPYNICHALCTQTIPGFITKKFPNAQGYFAALNNYEYSSQTSYIISNALIGTSNTSSSLSFNVQRLITNTPTYSSNIPFLADASGKFSGERDATDGAEPLSLGAPAYIRNLNGMLISERWYYTGELTGTLKIPLNIIGPMGFGYFINPERGALWRIIRENAEIEINLMNPVDSQVGTNAMYSAETVLF